MLCSVLNTIFCGTLLLFQQDFNRAVYRFPTRGLRRKITSKKVFYPENTELETK